MDQCNFICATSGTTTNSTSEDGSEDKANHETSGGENDQVDNLKDLQENFPQELSSNSKPKETKEGKLWHLVVNILLLMEEPEQKQTTIKSDKI